MLFLTLKDPQRPVAQDLYECALACLKMALRLRGGVDDRRVHADLKHLLQPARWKGASFADIAQHLQRRYHVSAHAGVSHDLEEVIELVRSNAVIIGVDASILSGVGGPPQHHALYVAGAEIPLSPLPKVVPSWRPAMRDVPNVTLVDPEPLLLGRYERLFDDVSEAFTGHYLAVSLRRP